MITRVGGLGLSLAGFVMPSLPQQFVTDVTESSAPSQYIESRAVLPGMICPRKPLIIGCGPAAKRNYLPELKKMQGKNFDEIGMLVEFESEEARVNETFKNVGLSPKNTLWLPANASKSAEMSDHITKKLDLALANGEIDSILILSSPQSHMTYLRWAITRGVPVLLEKPISAPIGSSISEEAAKQIWKDFLEIEELQNKFQTPVTVMVQRRAHAGYQFLMEYIRKFVIEFNVPITNVEVFKSDGLWTFPHEYDKENHSFKDGYGMLMHGGFHFIDLLAQVVEISGRASNKKPDSISSHASFTFPSDALTQINSADYAKFFPGYDAPDVNSSKLGEVDCDAILDFKQGSNTLTRGRLSLLHNGFSRRAWPISKADTYKGNGRVRHQQIHIVAGPLLSILVHSYEAFEEHDTHSPSTPAIGSTGAINHFEIQIFRNSAVIGGKPVEILNSEDFGFVDEKSNIQGAREQILNDFFNGKFNQQWNDFRLSTKILSELSLCAARAKNNKPAFSESSMS